MPIEKTAHGQGGSVMFVSARSRVTRSQILFRAGAFFFVATGLFLGALLAALG